MNFPLPCPPSVPAAAALTLPSPEALPAPELRWLSRSLVDETALSRCAGRRASAAAAAVEVDEPGGALSPTALPSRADDTDTGERGVDPPWLCPPLTTPPCSPLLLPRLEPRLLCAVTAAELRALLALTRCSGAGGRGTVSTRRLPPPPLRLPGGGCDKLPGGTAGLAIRTADACAADRSLAEAVAESVTRPEDAQLTAAARDAAGPKEVDAAALTAAAGIDCEPPGEGLACRWLCSGRWPEDC